ncbi:TMV resistance protein N-like [Lotus japonicus]|uniref:TMV resistance protein N-like n=1 Tax=Lotus japonicus TaxID=34305 RepID=UPI0025896EFF|nr:TMV resistance protein N-like [Lotus japonicus]
MQYDHEKGLVGIEEHCAAIEGFSQKFGRIGVWGMGGTGKTTIARALFDKHSSHYDSVCFLKDIREESQKHRGLAYLHHKLLSELLKEQVTTSNISESSLSSRRVLIVLDDVDSSEQLEALFVGLGELGEGSSLIVTTRDRHLLHEKIVDKIHEVKPLDSKKSLVLFNLGAFKKREPADSFYQDYSQRVVKYAEGLPLALKILGSHFYVINQREWFSEVGYLENRSKSYKDILDKLKVSYNGLSRQEQAIFLEIAFFFKDRKEDFVIKILDACGFNATSSVMEVLKDKSLITISKSNTIQMLDFLQDIAFDIVENDVTNPRRGILLRDKGVNSLDCGPDV